MTYKSLRYLMNLININFIFFAVDAKYPNKIWYSGNTTQKRAVKIIIMTFIRHIDKTNE